MRQTQYGHLHLVGDRLARYLFLSLLLGTCAQAQVIDKVSATATQALVRFTAPTSPACTIQVSESSNYNPLDADTDPALFANANTEAAHLVNSWAYGTNTTRTLRIGLRTASLALDGFRHSRALAANTAHYLAVTCNGSTATATFTTGVPGGSAPEPPPTDPTAWGQVAFPEFTDFSKPVIEPHTGMKIYSADPNGWSSSQTVAMPSGSATGGTGWTNFSNLSGYGSAVATTSNTNPANVLFSVSGYADGVSDVGGYWPYDNFTDLGLDVYGSGTDASATNRTIQVGLSLDSGQTIYSTSTVTLALPRNTNAAAGTVPSTYPAAYFSGWGKPIPRTSWPKCGYVTASAGAVTLTKDCGGNAIGTFVGSVGGYFNTDWVAGTKIYIAGSSATCTNNFCTLASAPTDSFHLALVENLTIGTAQYVSQAIALVINKTNSTGSVSLSVRFHVAKAYPQDLWTGGCAVTTVTSGDGITGYPCIFPRVRQDTGALYFIGISQPVIRLISLFVNAPGSCTNNPASDCPNGSSSILGPATPQFDPTDPTKMYIAAPTNAGKTGIFKVQYTGTWLAYNNHYVSTNIVPPNTYELSWTNLTPAASGRDLRSQILANTAYNETTWPSLSEIQTAGLTGPYYLFDQTIGTQNTACWIFAFTASTGIFYKAWRTDDGSSDPLLHFAGCHAVIPVDGTTAANGPAFLIANDGLYFNNPGAPLGGPFAGTPTAVYRGGVGSPDTSLPWPADNTYDNTCPSGLPDWIVANGATGNQCVKMDLPQPCSSVPTAGEIVSNPCPYAPTTKSSLGNLAVGDFLKDNTSGSLYDGEGLMVVQIVSATTSAATVWLQRNANFSYCAFGKDGVLSAGQLLHNNGWSYTALANSSCYTTLNLVDIVGGKDYVFNQNIIRGHFDLTQVGAQTTTMIGAGAINSSNQSVYPVQFQRPWSGIAGVSDFLIRGSPAFAGYQSDQGTQSYIDAKQFSASADLKQYAFDFRHYNGNTGVDLEVPGQTLGNNTNLTLQSGTAGVYLMSFTGTADVKHQALNVWAGHRYLIDISSAAAGNTITDATPWSFCYAYKAGECRTGSSAGALYISGPFDLKTQCWQSQMNLNVPCAFAGPTEGMNATQIRVSTADPTGLYQRWLGQLLMVPEAQYVYSKVLPTPDASYLLFGGFLTSGYHTGLMMAQLPPFPNDSIARNTYVPVMVKGSGSDVYIEFGYDEYGSDGVTKFYCTTRAENCLVAGSTINEANPFSYASESLTNANGYSIAIPALPGHVLYYHAVTGGVAGPTQVVAVP